MATVTLTDAGGMESLDFIASLVRSLAWPVAILLVAWLFRRPIAERIRAISKVSHGDTQIEFDHAAKEAQAAIIAVPNSGAAASHFLAELPDALPARIGRIVHAWNDIERWLRERVRVEGLNASPPVVVLLQAGVRQDVLTNEQAQSLRGLYVMRNLAVHGQPDEIDEGRVREFLTLADAIKLLLDIP